MTQMSLEEIKSLISNAKKGWSDAARKKAALTRKARGKKAKPISYVDFKKIHPTLTKEEHKKHVRMVKSGAFFNLPEAVTEAGKKLKSYYGK